MNSLETDILANLKTRLAELAWVVTVDSDINRALITDYRDNEMPVIQIADAGKTKTQHQQRRIQYAWNIDISVAMKHKVDDTVTQSILLNRIDDIERKIGAYVQLDLEAADGTQGEMIHVSYLGALTDPRTLRPYYIAVLTFQAIYLKPYTGEC